MKCFMFLGAVEPSRNKTSVVTYRVPHNACVQIYDYKEKKARQVVWPLVISLHRGLKVI